jgi:F-type H+-transporting ATPase subunit c
MGEERRKNMYRNTAKILFSFAATVVVWLMTSPVVAFAADVIPNQQDPYVKVIFSVGAMIGAGLAIGLGCIGAGAGIGNAAAGASEAVGRNPAAQGKIMMTMMVGMAMAESIAIYSLVISLILLFVNPFKAFLFG